MAEETKTAPKKTTAKRKPAAKTTAKKATAKRKPITRKAAPKKTAKKATPIFSVRTQEAYRNAFLASLGFYGKAFDQVQEQFNTLQDQLEARRAKTDKVYKELVKRGTKVEKNAKKAINEIELPKLELDNLTDRKKLDAQLKKAKARFEELKDTLNFKAAA